MDSSLLSSSSSYYHTGPMSLDQSDAQRRSQTFTTSTSSSIDSLDHLPISPTFSSMQSTRFSSTNSSIASSPGVRSSLDSYRKMPLKEVEEEREKESNATMSRDQVVSTLVEDIANREYLDATSAFPDYDWIDSPLYDPSDYEFITTKRRCAYDTTSSSLLTSRLTGRFPSITKKFKVRRDNRSSSITGSMNDSFVTRSRASSLRSPSIFDKNDIFPTSHAQDPLEFDHESILNVREEEELLDLEQARAASRTPLLPPVLALKTEAEEPIQSPLQSPSVDATASLPQSPFTSPNAFNNLPSPSLSTKPSVASFHHRSILPSADIPIINLADTQDEWSTRLGHGNFTITPEPYQLQAPVTLAACQRLKADWELARQNFRLHLERTGQVYNETSKTYYLTQAKWSSIDSKWKSCHEQALEDIPKISQEALEASFHSQDTPTAIMPVVVPVAVPVVVAAVASTTTTTTTTPVETSPTSPVIATCEGKFPTLAAGGIIGHMERIKPVTPRTCRKRSFWRFLQGVWPSSSMFGVSQA